MAPTAANMSRKDGIQAIDTAALGLDRAKLESTVCWSYLVELGAKYSPHEDLLQEIIGQVLSNGILGPIGCHRFHKVRKGGKEENGSWFLLNYSLPNIEHCGFRVLSTMSSRNASNPDKVCHCMRKTTKQSIFAEKVQKTQNTVQYKKTKASAKFLDDGG